MVRPPSAPKDKPDGDISITAMYTSATWHWAGFDAAELLYMKESRWVFRITNFVLWLTHLFRPGGDVLQYSLVQRHFIIDQALRRSGLKQVLEIAAGLSRRGASVSKDSSINYTELDLPHMVQSKRELLEQSDAGKAVLARPNLKLVPGDAATVDFDKLIPGKEPTFVISEGLLMYLKAPEQRALWTKMAALVKARPGSSYIFDLVPRVEFNQEGRSRVGEVLSFFMKFFTRGKTFELDDRDRHDISAELKECGFATVEVFEPRQMGEAWGLPHLDKDTQILLFLCR